MKARLVALFLFAACATSPDQAQTQLNPAKDPCCAECPAGCCAEEKAKPEAKSECCAEEKAKAEGKSECCAAGQAAAKPKVDDK
jgi:hypothetical protein